MVLLLGMSILSYKTRLHALISYTCNTEAPATKQEQTRKHMKCHIFDFYGFLKALVIAVMLSIVIGLYAPKKPETVYVTALWAAGSKRLFTFIFTPTRSSKFTERYIHHL